MKRIEVTKEERSRIAEAFSSSEVTVWRALTYRVNTSRAQKIRMMALRRGGRIVDDAPLSMTIEEAAGLVIQTWAGGKVRLEVHKETAEATWYVDGKKRGTKSVAHPAELMGLQKKLEALSGALGR
ncbi:MAG: hypothetical protein SOW44_09060 [Porphyromonas sp.]|nr:hypothetical protein [Bacteroidales bacterium]MDD7559323.1 hypothetical protein [Bacteroidales bacterium]MDY3101470.1 hypothetical protein [Porphyromonas sp.]